MHQTWDQSTAAAGTSCDADAGDVHKANQDALLARSQQCRLCTAELKLQVLHYGFAAAIN